MKNFRRLISVALVVLMMASLSISAFAAYIDEADTYTFEAKVDKTTVKAGDTFVVSVYVYGSGDSFDIASDGDSKLIYGYTVPKALVDMTGVVNQRNMFNAAYISKNYTLVAAKGNVNQESADAVIVTESISINDEVNYADATILKNKSIADYTFKVAENVEPGTYTIAIDAKNIAAIDNYTGVQMKSVVAAPAVTITVEGEEEISPSTASITSEMKTIVTENATYSNVWVGAIKVVLGNDGVTGVYAKYNNGKTTKTYDVDGDGEVKATVAIVGAPADAVVEAILVK